MHNIWECSYQLTAGAPDQGKVDVKELREKQLVARAGMLRGSHGYIPEAAFYERRNFFIDKVCTSCQRVGHLEVLTSHVAMLGCYCRWKIILTSSDVQSQRSRFENRCLQCCIICCFIKKLPTLSSSWQLHQSQS